MTANNSDDFLARLDAELDGNSLMSGQEAREISEAVASGSALQEMADATIANLPGIDRIEFVSEETGQAETVIERIPETEQAVVMRYDLVLGLVPADLDGAELRAWLDEQERQREAERRAAEAAENGEETQDTPEAPETSPEDEEAALRQAIIDDQMAGGEDAARRAAREAENRLYREQAERQAELERLERERAIREIGLEAVAKIRDYLGSYLVFPSALRDAQLDVLTMWALHTYSYKVSGVTPYLAVTAPTQGSGKTTVLELLSTLANNPSKVEVNPTEPVVRLMCSDGRTVFLDEVDTLTANKNFIATMNSGYKAGGSVTRVRRSKDGEGTETSSTFAPKAIAGIAREGTLPLPTATLDRCIEIKIIRAKPGELEKRFRVDVMREDPEVLGLCDWAANWTGTMRKKIRDAYVELPRLSSSRAEQIWEPLITLAHLIGGDWYRRICAAAILLDGGREQNIDPNAAMVEDIATVVDAFTAMCPEATTIKADDIASLRNVLTGRKLTEKLTTDQLTKRLGAFGIKAEVMTEDGEPALVYNLTDGEGNLLPEWTDLFSRYGER